MLPTVESSIETKDYNHWDLVEVMEWISRVNISSENNSKTFADIYGNGFKTNEINGQVLEEFIKLSAPKHRKTVEQRLADIGIEDSEHVERFLVALVSLKVNKRTFYTCAYMY